MKSLRVGVLVSLCACFTSQAPDDHNLQVASTAASRNERETAYRAYAGALRSPGLSEEKKASILFEMGLLRQEQAEESQPNRIGYLHEAIALYERALEISPEDGGTLNNLARAYGAVGDPRADTMFQELIKRTDDRNLAVYLFNYGLFLESRGESEGAAVMRKRAADADAGDPESQLEILRLYIPRGSREALSYLRPILDKGYASNAYDYLIDTLALPDIAPADREQFTISVAKSLSLQSYDPAAFLNSLRGKRLAALQDNESSTTAISELVALHRNGDLSPDAFPWWSDPTSDARRHAFIDLAARMGTWYVQHHDLNRAGHYYDLAARIPGTSASVIQALAQIYASLGRGEALRQLSSDAEGYLATASAPDAYAVRRELGMSLAALGEIGPPNQVASSLYQLTKTSEIAYSFNSRNRSAGVDERLPVDMALIGTLEKGWDAVDAPGRALEVRVVAARDLLGDKNIADAVDVLRMIQDDDLTRAFTADPRLRGFFADAARDAGLASVALTHWPQNGSILTANTVMTSSAPSGTNRSLTWTRYSLE